MKQKILITGGAGFIGSNTANILSKDYEIIVLDDLSFGKINNVKSANTLILSNVLEKRVLNRIKNIDYVIHLAAISASPMFLDNLSEAYNNNLIGFVNVLEFARKNKVKKVLFASTSSIYGHRDIPYSERMMVDPRNFYSAERQCEEETARIYNELYGLEIFAFRLMSIYGLNEKHKGVYANLVSQFLWDMKKDKRPEVYGNKTYAAGSQTRDLTDVRDVVQAFKRGIETNKKLGYRVFNVGTGKETSLIQLIGKINKALNKNLKPKFIENKIGSSYIQRQKASLIKINLLLGYKPTIDIDEGIKYILEN